MKRLFYFLIFTLGLFIACKQGSTPPVEKQVMDVNELKKKVQNNEHYLAYHKAFKELAELASVAADSNQFSKWTLEEKEAHHAKAMNVELKMNESLLKLFKAYPEFKNIKEDDLKYILPPINPMSTTY